MNLASIVEQHPATATALVFRGTAISYGELRRDIASMRGALLANGVEAGDTVALLCGNSRYFVVSYFATLGIGAAAVPLNLISPAAELQRELDEVQPSAVVIEPAAVSSWNNIDQSSFKKLRLIVAAEGHDVVNAKTFDQLLQHAPANIVEVDQHAIAALIFTSGTAGAPRAAMLSHHNLLTNLQQLMQLSPLNQQDVVFGVLPLFHIFGLNVVLGLSIFVGASVVLVQRFDPVTALETFAERRVTVVPGAPPVWTALSQVPGINAASFSTVRLALTGASKMPEDITRMLADKCGVVVHEGYGLTEASPVISMSVGRTVHVGSIGHVLPGIELRLVDENGDDAESGDSGEIWVRGDNVFRGYLRDEEATSRVITPEGWLRTGDVAVRDDDGYLFLVDRVKDLIIVSGFNVYPAEVESVLNAHAAIAQSAVVGVAHPHTGEAVRAYVVLESGAYLDEESVIEWCQKHVARYKCPSKVLIVESLPTGGTGKVLRRALR